MNRRKASLAFIFLTATIDMIGMGIVIPSLPHIMRRFLEGDALVSSHYGYFISLFACMQFLASPLLGALSDRFGRRPVLLLSLAVAGFDYILMAFAPNLSILFLGRILSGLTSAGYTVAMAYIADISTDENRSKNFGLIGASFGLGFIIGPALGGLLSGYGPQYPFLAAAALNLLNFCFGFFVLPESFPLEKRRPLSAGSLNPFQTLLKIARMPGLVPLVMAHFLFQLAGQTHPSIWILYTEARFQWNTAQVGLSMAMVGVLAVAAQGWLTGVVVPKFGEYHTVLAGTLGLAVGYALFGMATKGWMMYAVLFGTASFWVTYPALQALISKKVSSDAQGELQGSLTSLTSLASIINPLVTTQLFAYFSGVGAAIVLPGAPYFFAALVCALTFPLILGKAR